MKTPNWVEKGLHLAHKPRKNGVLEQDPQVYNWIPYEKKTCSYCDKTVWEDRIECRKMWTPTAHWRCKCVNCKRYYDYDTGKFDIAYQNANYKINCRLRDK